MQMRISSISSNAHLGASSLYNLSPLFCQMLNKSPEEKMGCTSSVYALGRKKKVTISEVVLYVPSVTIPVQSDPPRALKGEIPKEPLDRLTCLRNQIVLVAEDTDGSSMTELRRALEEYMSLLIGFTKKEHGLEYLVEFKWKKLDDYGKEEFCVANSWFELLCVVHLMAMLTLSEANTLLISKDYSGSGVRVVSSVLEFIHKIVREKLWIYCFKASGYLEFCVKNILVPIPPDIKNRLPKDLQDGVLEATSIQALGQKCQRWRKFYGV